MKTVCDRVGGILGEWNVRRRSLGISCGIAAGYATLGRVGFGKRFDYAAIDIVTNVVWRLCYAAAPHEILLLLRSHQHAGELQAVACDVSAARVSLIFLGLVATRPRS